MKVLEHFCTDADDVGRLRSSVATSGQATPEALAIVPWQGAAPPVNDRIGNEPTRALSRSVPMV